jgi:hypothetical protein
MILVPEIRIIKKLRGLNLNHAHRIFREMNNFHDDFMLRNIILFIHFHGEAKFI